MEFGQELVTQGQAYDYCITHEDTYYYFFTFDVQYYTDEYEAMIVLESMAFPYTNYLYRLNVQRGGRLDYQELSGITQAMQQQNLLLELHLEEISDNFGAVNYLNVDLGDQFGVLFFTTDESADDIDFYSFIRHGEDLITESETYHYSIYDEQSNRQYYFFAYQVAQWSEQYEAEIMFESGAINTAYHYLNLHVSRQDPNEVVIEELEEIVDPVVEIDDSIIVEYNALSEITDQLRESSNLVEFDAMELSNNYNVFDISATAGETVGIMFFVNNNDYRRVDISVPSGQNLISQNDVFANQVARSDSDFVYYYRSFKMNEDVSDVEASIELEIGGIDQLITINVARTVDFRELRAVYEELQMDGHLLTLHIEEISNNFGATNTMNVRSGDEFGVLLFTTGEQELDFYVMITEGHDMIS